MERFYKFTPNHRNKTFTIRVYDKKDLSRPFAKYRSMPQDKENFSYYCNYATQNDMAQFMKSGDYILL